MAERDEKLKHLLVKAKDKSEKDAFKLNIQKIKITASGPIISWQTEGEKVEAVTDFILLGAKITADTVFSHEMKRHLLLGRKAMTNLGTMLKGRNITLLTKVQDSQSYGFSIIYGCESWTIKKAECLKPVIWPPDAKSQLYFLFFLEPTLKNPDAGKD